MGGNPAAGLLLTLFGLLLGGMYVTGRLEWLFALGNDLNAARTGTPATPAPAPTGGPTSTVPGPRTPTRPSG